MAVVVEVEVEDEVAPLPHVHHSSTCDTSGCFTISYTPRGFCPLAPARGSSGSAHGSDDAPWRWEGLRCALGLDGCFGEETLGRRSNYLKDWRSWVNFEDHKLSHGWTASPRASQSSWGYVLSRNGSSRAKEPWIALTKDLVETRMFW